MNTAMEKVTSYAIEELHTLPERLENTMESVLSALTMSERVIVSGVGKSGIIAQKIAATLTSVGKPSHFLHPIEAMHGDIGIVDKSSVVIILSNSGATSELLSLIPYLKKRNIIIIGILGNTDSPLAKVCNYVLDASVKREACPLNLAPTTSTLIALAIGDMIAVGYMERSGFTPEEFAISHPAGLLGKSLSMTVKEVMYSGVHLPIIESSATFKQAIIESSHKSLGGVIISDNGLTIDGLLTDGDVRRVLEHYDDLRDVVLSKVMTRNPVTIHESALLGEALALMEHRKSKIGFVPVINSDSEIVGVIRLHDIIA